MIDVGRRSDQGVEGVGVDGQLKKVSQLLSVNLVSGGRLSLSSRWRGAYTDPMDTHGTRLPYIGAVTQHENRYSEGEWRR